MIRKRVGLHARLARTPRLRRRTGAGVLRTLASELLANEFAPRVHNSGHWTIEGSATSQFENHLRAILDYAIGLNGKQRPRRAWSTLIGHIPESVGNLRFGASLMIMEKTPRPGRKLGHITVVAESADKRDALIQKLVKSVTANHLPRSGTGHSRSGEKAGKLRRSYVLSRTLSNYRSSRFG